MSVGARVRSIVGADAREASDGRKDRIVAAKLLAESGADVVARSPMRGVGRVEDLEPILGVDPLSRDEDHGGRPRSSTFDEHAAVAADVDRGIRRPPGSATISVRSSLLPPKIDA